MFFELCTLTEHLKLRLKAANSYTVLVISDPEGNSQFCFPENPDVSRDEVKGNIRTRGKTELTGLPRDLTLSVLLYF